MKLSQTLIDLFGYRIVRERKLHTLPEQRHLRKMLRFFDVDCVFDVGANAGQYATMLRQQAGFKGRIISFEPTPTLVEALRKKSAKDPLWHIEACGLGDATETRAFNIIRDSQFNSFSTPRHDETDRFNDVNQVVDTINVNIETLGHAHARLHAKYGFERPYLKLDTQGYDVQVVRDQAETLQHFVGLQSELSMKRIYASSVDFRDAIALYQSLGYELSAIVPNNAGHFPLLIERDGIFVRRDLAAVTTRRRLR